SYYLRLFYRLSPIVQQVGERLIERDARFPPDLALDSAPVAPEDEVVARPVASCIDRDLDRHRAERDQTVEHVADLERLAGADVIDPSGITSLYDGGIRADR